MKSVMAELRQRGLVPERRVEILAVALLRGDYVNLRNILEHSRWKLRRALTCRRALRFLRWHPVGVVVSDPMLPDGSWKDLLAALAALPVPPNLIVASRLADEQLWAEVLNLGGYDVLLTPFEPEELFRVCSAAWRDWSGRVEAAARFSGRQPANAAGMPVPIAHAAP